MDFRKIRKAAEDQGFETQETTRGYVLFFKDGKFITRYPKTPSSSRTIKNVLADLRRAGLQYTPR
jgi:hypothetical protein